jgi:hypothetical protein
VHWLRRWLCIKSRQGEPPAILPPCAECSAPRLRRSALPHQPNTRGGAIKFLESTVPSRYNSTARAPTEAASAKRRRFCRCHSRHVGIQQR